MSPKKRYAEKAFSDSTSFDISSPNCGLIYFCHNYEDTLEVAFKRYKVFDQCGPSAARMHEMVLYTLKETKKSGNIPFDTLLNIATQGKTVPLHPEDYKSLKKMYELFLTITGVA